MSQAKQQFSKDIIVRNYKPGDEDRIVKFLNLCYGEWGTPEKWRALYSRHPTFKNEDIFIIEKDDQIIGHESLHYRDLEIPRASPLNTATLSDAATHPLFRGQRLHNKLIEVMLETARANGAGLVFSWYLRGTGLHAHSKKIGFVEIKQPSAFMKVMRPGKVLQSGLSDFLQKNPRLKLVVPDFGNITLQLGEYKFSIMELLGAQREKPSKIGESIEIFLDESSITVLAKFRTLSMRQRLQSLIMLLLLRKAKIRFHSFAAFFNLIRKVVAAIGSI